MLKKLCLLLVGLTGLAAAAHAEEAIKQLPVPAKEGGMPLMEAITERKTTREFSAKAIDNQTLSEILYAAWGISHDGKHTIPTSQNKQNLNVYVADAGGVWLYDPSQNQLKQVKTEDIRPLFATQDFMKDAPLTLIFTGTDAKNSPLHAGSAYQNVGLYAASRGLNNVVRAYFDHKAVAEAMGLAEDEVIVSQTVGWPYM